MSILRRFASTAAVDLSLSRCLQMAFQQRIDQNVCQSLQKNGYAVIDSIFGAEIASRLLEEIQLLERNNFMHLNHTHLVTASAGRVLIPKNAIYEAELMLTGTQKLAPMCSLLQFDSTLQKSLCVHLPHIALDRQAIKLQANTGNQGSFPMHLDTEAAIDGRIITAIWYLNPNWSPGDGGELRVYPFPQKKTAIDIAPLMDRLVLFSSRKMVHRVLPSLKPRYCFTIWVSGSTTNQGTAEEERAMARRLLMKNELSDDEARQLLHLEEIRKYAIKWYYREEWARSLRESHLMTEAGHLVDSFWREIGVIERALKPLLPALGDQWGGGVDVDWV